MAASLSSLLFGFGYVVGDCWRIISFRWVEKGRSMSERQFGKGVLEARGVGGPQSLNHLDTPCLRRKKIP